MTRRRWIQGLVLAALLPALAGCSTIYTARDYGPQVDLVRLTPGLTLAEVMAVLGQPDMMNSASGNGTTVAVYRSIYYRSILGLYVENETHDFVLTFQDGKLISQNWVKTGVGTSIVGYQVYSLGVDKDSQ